MTQIADDRSDRIARRQVDKFAERRAQLAESALKTLSELGYARTSLREIAQNSEFSHGVLHYYFRDKVELITHCVRQYKVECVKRYDNVVATASTPAELKRDFAAAMASTLREDAHLHRLWYDMRNQSLFEDIFRTDVLEIDNSLQRMIWRVVSQYSELADQPLTVSEPLAYATFDGIFQQALLKHTSGDQHAADELAANVEQMLQHCLYQPPDGGPIPRAE